MLGCVIGASVRGIGLGDTRGGRMQPTLAVLADVPLAAAPETGRTSSPIDVAQIRAVFREELSSALTRLPQGVGSTSGGSRPAAPLTDEQLQQRQRALQAVSAIVWAGQYGPEERMKFHRNLALLDSDQRKQALQNLAHAINSGAMKVSMPRTHD
jgi:hypothetical protein